MSQEQESKMSGDSEGFQYPGVNLPLRFLDQHGKHGVDFFRLGSSEGLADSCSELLQIREVAMNILMDRLTDKPDWHEKVFNDEIVSKWRNEALTQDEEGLHLEILDGKNLPTFDRTRIISEQAFDYCIAELRCKAAHFKETGLVFTLTSGWNTAVKSDTVVSDELHKGLRAAFEKLRADQAAKPDWHPGTDDVVQDLVHPSMYPFVYGKSKFIQEEVVGVADAVDKWAGKGEIVPKNKEIEVQQSGRSGEDIGEFVNREYWSETYQWLPANLAFREDGTVKFTSYINNLHPKRYPEVYALVEKLIDTAIPAWDRVLKGKPIFTHPDNGNPALQKRFDMPPESYYDNEETEAKVWEPFNADALAAYEKEHGQVRYDQREVEWWCKHDKTVDNEDPEVKRERFIGREKWREIREAILPEPLPFEPLIYQVKRALHSKFKETGLQVIVKMASIELTPEKPEFPAGGWHIEGQMNEHIVATALYYLDSENVTTSSLSFRMRTDNEQEDIQARVGQDQYGSYEQIFGTKLGLNNSDAANVQPYGSVETREGRLLAFPNVFQHRVSSFKLADPTKPGHRRFIALWLVDPFTRIISTANVPPQQLDWWADAVFGGGENTGDLPPELFQVLLEQGVAQSVKPSSGALEKLHNRLPAEIMDMVRKERAVPDELMTYEEACEHRLALMEERTAFIDAYEGEWQYEYSFCEH